MYQNPLSTFHTISRGTAASGYPNMPFFSPHPYEMALAGVNNRGWYPFQYQRGWMNRRTPMDDEMDSPLRDRYFWSRYQPNRYAQRRRVMPRM